MAKIVEVKRREGESSNALLYRFMTKVKRSGVIMEMRKRRFRDRAINRMKRRASAIHREITKKDMERARKLGLSTPKKR